MPVKSNIYVQGTPVRLQVRQNPLIGTDPRRRFVISDPIHPIHDLDLLRRAPASHEGIRDCCVEEVVASASLTTPRVLALRAVSPKAKLDGVEVHPSAPQLASSHAMIRSSRLPKPSRRTAILSARGTGVPRRE